MNKRSLMIMGVTVAVLLLCIGVFYFTRPEPLAKESPEPALTPTEAGTIALKEFPQGKISMVSLEERASQYYYEITILNNDEKYRVEVALPSGQVLAAEPIPAQTEPFLPLSVVAERLQGTYPASNIADIELKSEDDFIFYQTEIIQDNILHEIYFHPVSGTVIKQTQTNKQISADFSQWLSFPQIIEKITQLLPDAKLIELELDYDETQPFYDAKLIDEGNEYELTLDAVTGDMLEKDITPYEDDSQEKKLWQVGFKSVEAQPTAMPIE